MAVRGSMLPMSCRACLLPSRQICLRRSLLHRPWRPKGAGKAGHRRAGLCRALGRTVIANAAKQSGVFPRRQSGSNWRQLLPHARELERQQSQHAADQSDHRVGLREHSGLDEDLARDGEAEGGEQQAGAAGEDRKIAYRERDGPGGCGISHAGWQSCGGQRASPPSRAQKHHLLAQQSTSARQMRSISTVL